MKRELIVLNHSTGEKYLLLGDKRIDLTMELIKFLVTKGIKVVYQ